MKKLLLLLFFVGFGGYSQEKDTIEGKHLNPEWAKVVAHTFGGLDLKKVPFGLLIDHAIEFTNVRAYNGIPSDSARVNLEELGNIYKTLLMARVDPDTIHMPRFERYAKDWAFERLKYNAENQNTIVLSGLYYKYSGIRSNALEQHSLNVVDGQYFDVYEGDTWRNPYEQLETLAFSPPIQIYNRLNFNVVLPKELFLTNDRVEQISVDFGDGKGLRDVAFDFPLTVSYSENSENKLHTWIFKIQLEGGRQLISKTSFVIKSPIDQVVASVGSNNVFIPYNTESSLVGQGAILRIDYAPSHNGQLVKPFIVAEGFDSGFITAPEIIGGDRTLNGEGGFLADINFAGQLYSLLNSNLQQYDIVYVDWQNGTNDIKHNSQVFRNVISWVNEHKQGNEQNVVLGQSMGGLIGRYTLAKMEHEGQNHDVKLFISHDAPLQGANTPLCTQFFTRHIYDEYVDSGTLYAIGQYGIPTILNLANFMSAAINALGGNTSVGTYVSPETLLTIQDTPAALQMNYHYVDGFSHATKIFHEAWQSEFKAIGYPQLCRNVAISNGNECAVDQGFEANDKLISYHKNSGNPNLLGELALAAATPLIGLALSNYSLFFVGLLPGSSKFYYNFDLYTNPKLDNDSRVVYRGNLRYRKMFLGITPIMITLMERKKSAPFGFEPFDIYSGGYFDISNVIDAIGDSMSFVSITDDIYINKTFDFIPVVSALDIKRNNGNVYESDYYRKYAGGVPLPSGLTTEFDNFVVGYGYGNTNFPHISFQARNGNWLRDELTAGPNNPFPEYNCLKFCTDAIISGPKFICGSSTYSVTDEATQVDWSIDGGANLITSASNGMSFTLTPVSTNVYGYVTLTATFSNDKCGPATATLHIWVGKPNVASHVINGGNDNVGINAFSNLNVDPVQGVDHYFWFFNIISTDCGVDANGLYPPGVTLPQFQIPGGTSSTLTSTSPYCLVNWGNCKGSYVVSCRAINDCGISDITHKLVNVYNASGGSDPCEPFLSVYPNPIANGNLNIELKPAPTNPCPNNGPTAPVVNLVKLYDLYGNLLFSNTYNTDIISISGLNLTTGHYALNVLTSKGYVEREIIVVQ